MKAAAVRHPTCEKDFVTNALRKGIRLDGRQAYDYRAINVEFGADYGCCEVMLGDTRVIAQSSCELIKPPESRPMEGQLFINVELSPMASPAFEIGRMSDFAVEVNRLTERCLKESRAIDLESLCLIANEKVWCVRVDVIVMNDGGNILDCCCIAAISSLAHFRYPDVTVTGNEVIVHSPEDKHYVPLRIHHMPIMNTFGFLNSGQQVIIDPEEKEECIISGRLVIALNMHAEICCAQMSGGVSLDYEQIIQCAKIASVKATDIVELIKAGLEEDRLRREPASRKRRPGLKDPITKEKLIETIAEPTKDDLTEVTNNIEDPEPIIVDASLQPINNLGPNKACVGDGGESTWVLSDSEEEEPKMTSHAKESKENYVIDDDDEEEEELMQLSNDLEITTVVKPRNNENIETIDIDGNKTSPKMQSEAKAIKNRKRKKKKKKPIL